MHISTIDFKYAQHSRNVWSSTGPTKETTMPFANFKVPQGTMSAEQKEDLIHKTTAIFVGYFGEGVRPYTMVLVDEVADGGYGRADETLTIAKMQKER
jgi:4-oxalocrotonate tautomerase